MKLRLLTYFICVIVACLSCACGKRTAGPDDEKFFLELERKFSSAEAKSDYPELSRISGQMEAFAKQFVQDDTGRMLTDLAYIRKGTACCYLGKKEEAVRAYDFVIETSPIPQCVLQAYSEKMTLFLAKKYAQEMNAAMAACRQEYGRIKQRKNWSDDPAFRREIQGIFGNSIGVYSLFLYRMKQYDQAEKLISDFLSEFGSEADFEDQVGMAAGIYYIRACVWREKNDFAREQLFLQKGFALAKRGKEVYNCLYLRLAAYAFARKEYDTALRYCDAGIASCSGWISKTGQNDELGLLLLAKSRICREIGSAELADELERKAHQADPDPNLLRRFNYFWIKTPNPDQQKPFLSD